MRFLVCLLGGCVLLGTGWYFLHGFQVQRHAAALLEYARQAEAQERFDRATRFVQLYVDLVPTDTEARARYGLLLDRIAQSPNARYVAMQVFDQVLLREPDRHDIRRRLIALAVELGLFDDALQHLNVLVRTQRNDGELEHQLGVCLEARANYAEAKAQYQLAISH